MGLGSSFLKALVFIFNFLIATCGIAILAVGVISYFHIKQFSEVKDYVDAKISAPPIVFIVLGIIIFLIAFCGCCGTLQESTCLITTYAIVLTVILIAELVIGIYVFANSSTFQKDVVDKFDEGFKKKDKDFMDMFHSFEKTAECCGMDGPSDYGIITKLPDSCCNTSIQNADCTLVFAYHDGCRNKISDLMSFSYKIIGGVAIGLGAILLAGIISAFCLRSEFKRFS